MAVIKARACRREGDGGTIVELWCGRLLAGWPCQAIGTIAHRLCRLVWKILNHRVTNEERGPAVTNARTERRAVKRCSAQNETQFLPRAFASYRFRSARPMSVSVDSPGSAMHTPMLTVTCSACVRVSESHRNDSIR